MQGTVPAIIQKMKDEKSGFEKESTQEILTSQGFTKDNFRKLYKGSDPQDFMNEYGKYQREGWQTYQHKLGQYDAPTLNDFKNRDDQFFVKKYLKNTPNAFDLKDNDIGEMKERYNNIRISQNKHTELAQKQKKKSGFIVHFEKNKP